MKETGLMFKAPLVRAILSGQKTQTRRILKNQQSYDLDKCPLGQPGDRIYVREQWQGPLMSSKEWEDHYFSEADDSPAKFRTPAYCRYAADGGPPPEFVTMDDELVARWKPSIHMPKWAARIWLEITSVRIERLQDISDADCIAEGIKELPHQAAEKGCWWTGDVAAGAALHGRTPHNAFRLLWESTGGDWAANPWVWVIDFKRIEAQAAKED